VSADSKRFVLEVATFRPEPIRRASQRLALRTEASARFEKGLDTPRVDDAVSLFSAMLSQIAPSVSIIGMQDVDLDPTTSAQVDVDLEFLNTRIGQCLDEGEVRTTLESLGFAVTGEVGRLHITAPTWRSTGDISLPQDIVEEVARIHGYDNIPAAQLSVLLVPVRQLNRRPLARLVREQLAARAGMQEVVTYPWIADGLLLAVGLNKVDTLRFEGAPAPDRDSLRPSLVPNLLEAVVANLRYRETFGLFEAGTVFGPTSTSTSYHNIFEPLPEQRTLVAAALVSTDGPALFRRAKGVLEMLRLHCHLTDLRFVEACKAPWADRSARLGIVANDAEAGAFGLLTKRCRRLAGIEDGHVACFELDLDQLSAYRSRDNRYAPLSDLPESDFDLSVVIPDEVSWSRISSIVTSGVNELIDRVDFVDEFRGSWVPEGHKSVSLRVTLRPRTSTLTANDITAVRRELLTVLERDVSAHLRE